MFVFHVVRHEKNWTKIKKFVRSGFYIILKRKETTATKCQLNNEENVEV